MIPFTLTIRDAAGAAFSADHLWLFRARNRFEIPLADIRTDEGTPLDLSQMRSLRLEFRSAEKFERDLWLYDFYIAGAASLTRPHGEVLLDFWSAGSAVAGWFTAHRRAHCLCQMAWLRLDHGYEGGEQRAVQSAQARPHAEQHGLGRPRVAERRPCGWICPTASIARDSGAGTIRRRRLRRGPSRSAVDGAVVAARRTDPATFYTAAEYFRGIDDWYEPGEDTWAKFGRNLYEHFDFSFTVRGGKAEFTWSKTLAAFGLLIAPAADFRAADRARRSPRSAQAFEANLNLPQAGNREPAAGTRRPETRIPAVEPRLAEDSAAL